MMMSLVRRRWHYVSICCIQGDDKSLASADIVSSSHVAALEGGHLSGAVTTCASERSQRLCV
jgi:hypothetical protein